MTLRNKIALNFTLLTSSIVIAICFVIYWSSANYTHNDYFQRMRERANVAAVYKLEEDELSPRLFTDITRRHLQTLTDEQEYLIPLNGALLPKPLPDFLDSSYIKKIHDEGFATKMVGQTSVVGIRYEDNQGTFAVVITAFDRFGLRKLNNLRRVLFAVIIGYLLLVFFIGRWYARQALAPLTDIIRQMKTINSTNLHHRIPEPEKQDEISQLAHTFNNLLNRIETSVETQNNFISNASHELKNPLTAILGEIELVLKGEHSKQDYHNALVLVEKEAERLKNLTLRLLKLAQIEFSDNGKKQLTLARPDELLVDVVEELNGVTAPGTIKLSFGNMPEDTQDLELNADSNLLRIAFANVIENAVKFSEGKPIFISFDVDNQFFKIKVEDSGIGIPPTETGKIFAPFYRAGNATKFQGFGVGLPLVKKIVDIHEGNIRVESEPGKGTIVTISLPREQN